MRLFSGRGGALYLLGADAGGGRPRVLLATARSWRLEIDERIVDNGVLSPAADRPRLVTVTGKAHAALELADFRGDLALSLDDELLVEMGALAAVARIPPSLAVNGQPPSGGGPVDGLK